MEENLSKPACIRANSLQEEGKRRGEGEDLAMEKLLSLAEELSHYHSNARSIPTIWIFRQLSRSPDLHRWGQGRQPTIYFHAWNVSGRSIPILRQQEGEREITSLIPSIFSFSLFSSLLPSLPVNLDFSTAEIASRPKEKGGEPPTEEWKKRHPPRGSSTYLVTRIKFLRFEETGKIPDWFCQVKVGKLSILRISFFFFNSRWLVANRKDEFLDVVGCDGSFHKFEF